MKDLQACAIIPARGGSKGVPRKNLAVVGGETLIGRCVRIAREVEAIERVFVSTDDREIAAAAAAAGAEILWRPAELSTDTARSEDALLHGLELLRGQGYEPGVLLFLQCTSAFATREDLEAVLEPVLSGAADSAFTCVPFHRFVWRRDADGHAVAVNHDASERKRRQDREPEFMETGAAYAMRVPGFLAARHRFFGRVHAQPTDPVNELEIDSPADLALVQAIFSTPQRDWWERLPVRIGALVLDFDGVFTDNTVLVLPDGTEAVVCSRGDGMGIERVRAVGVPVLVISKERNRIAQVRCAKLGIECLNAVDNKREVLLEWLRSHSIDPAEVVYVGNDINDVECFEAVGLALAVADAHPSALGAAHGVLRSAGGVGAIREICDVIEGRAVAVRQ